MKFFSAVLVASALVTSSSIPLYAQQPNSVSPAEQRKNEEAFSQKVKQAVFGSCNTTAPIEDPRERSAACKCYSNAYVNRYSVQELFDINQWSIRNKSYASIVVTMMTPERRLCKIP